MSELTQQFKKASDAKTQLELVAKINKVRSHIETMATLASIRHTIDTRDKFYDDEQNYWDEFSPLYEEVNSSFYEAVVSSSYREELEDKLSKQFFTILDYRLKSFSPDINDLQEENKLSSDYTKLIASAKIMFDGEERTIPGMGKYLLSENREVREAASKAKYGFFEEHEQEIDDIYDQLVKVRTRIAKKLGFKNFVELGYVRSMVVRFVVIIRRKWLKISVNRCLITLYQ